MGTLGTINKLALNKSFKNKIKKTYLWSIFLKQFDSRHKTVNVLGFQIKYCSYGNFVTLFKDIFVKAEYYFITQKPTPLIIDCGSNIGMSVLFFKIMYPDSEIIAFEPNEAAFSCLETNIGINKLQSVSLHKKALSKKEGRIDFYFDQSNPGSLAMSTFQERMPKQKQTVEAVCLSKFIDRQVDFLKMDVEGAEFGIIEELSKGNKLKYIKQMAIEYHHHIIKDEDRLSTTLKLLEDEGFGYQLEGHLGRPFNENKYQDIMIYAYRKNNSIVPVP